MHTTPMVPLMMFGWLPFIVFLFPKIRPPHRAVIAGFLLAWMFLPLQAYKLPVLPDYDKIGAASYGILLGAFIHDRPTFSRFRFHPCDLPVALWCFASFCSSVANGLGAHDGASAMLGKVATWGIPYFIGRLYFDNARALKELAVGMFFGALVYIPFCWVEFAISPRLHKIVYGWHHGNFSQTKRGGGWRPTVFMKHGLMCAMWMASGALAGIGLFFSRAIGKRLPVLGLPTGLALAFLILTLVLCKSFGALALMLAGTAAFLFVRRFRLLLPVALLAIIPVLYVATRGTGWWDAQDLIAASESLSGAERADSLAFRIKNENLLIGKALEQAAFGWAGWKRSFVFNANGVATSVPDGLWIIAFGQNGIFGLATLTLSLLLPQLLFLRAFPARQWREPSVAAIAPLAILLGLFMVDNLFNDMFNPTMLLAAGGITGLCIRHASGERLFDHQPEPVPPLTLEPRLL